MPLARLFAVLPLWGILVPVLAAQQQQIDYFLGYQHRWINDPCQISIRDKSRRIGGTETVAF